MRYVFAYKLVYLLLIACNLLLFTAPSASGSVTPINTAPQITTSLALFVNLLGGVGLLRRSAWAGTLERLMSAGRMATIVAAASIAPVGLLFYSPSFMMIWQPLISLMGWSLTLFWLACATLMVVEVMYYRRIGGFVPSARPTG